MQTPDTAKFLLTTKEFKILAAGIFLPGSVKALYDTNHAIRLTAEDDDLIERIWNERLIDSQNKRISLYNSALFRLYDYEAFDKSLSLSLSNTTYREYVGTRDPLYHAAHAQTELANALAVCAVVHTDDGKILIEKRVGTDVYAGRYHVVGGFADREKDLDGPHFDPFGAIAREVCEETGLKLPKSSFVCTGLVYDVLTPHPELCFSTRSTDSFHVEKGFERSDGEIRALEFLEDSPESLGSFIRKNHGRISATGEPSLLLYGLNAYGEEWFDATRASIT
jgi:8-oxo-dGTP pyrophosphatase MutT (NUDIX family)